MSEHVLVVMGSGETTPTMVTPHQQVLRALGTSPRAVVLDTPYGFQENADDLSARTLEYFATNVGSSVEVVSLRAVDDPQDPEVERAQAAVADADWVFIGPGSPSYLVAQLGRTRIPELLRARLGPDGHGATVISSAAAATAGSRAIPVYEIYKAGHEPRWLPGLELLPALGIPAVLVPHYDNGEGGTHDTRFCYLGERRLTQLEGALDEDEFVLGVDEHTAMVVDLAARTVEVQGRGRVTVRRRDGVQHELPSGATTSLEELLALAHGTDAATDGPAPAATAAVEGAPAEADAGAAPLLEDVAAAEQAFAAAQEAHDAQAATDAVLDLERTLRAWRADSLTGDLMERATAVLRGLVTRLGEAAEDGMVDRGELVAPFVDLLLAEREAARDAREWAAADRIRDGLVAAGVEIQDTPDGTTWTLGGAA